MCVGGRYRESNNFPHIDIGNFLPEDRCRQSIIFLMSIPAAGITLSHYERWYEVWRTVPSFVFDITVAYGTVSDGSYFWAARQRFTEIVDRALNIREESQNPLMGFRLVHHYCDDTQSGADVGNWVRKAAGLGCQKLDLSFLDDDWLSTHSQTLLEARDASVAFTFRFADIANSRVAWVRLRSCDFVPDESSSPESRLDSLTNISLYWMEDVSYLEITRLLSQCRNLQQFTIGDVSFFDFEGIHTLSIHSSTLQILILGRHHRSDDDDEEPTLSVNAPNLASLTVYDFDMASYELNVPNLMEARVEFEDSSSPSQNLKMINQSLYVVERLLCHNVLQGCISEQYKNLTYLELITGFGESEISGLAEFLRASPLLEKLVVDHRPDTSTGSSIVDYPNFWKDRDYGSMAFRTPSLKEVILLNYQRTKNENYTMALLETSGKGTLNFIRAYPPKHSEEATILMWASSLII